MSASHFNKSPSFIRVLALAILMGGLFTGGPARAVVVDLSLGGGYRSQPVGGSGSVEAGLGQVVWGSEVDPLYGFMRVALAVEGVVDHVTSGGYIELFPVSIFGLRGGRMTTQSHLDYDDYDCNVYLCRGRREESFTDAIIFYGYERFRFSALLRRSIWSDSSSASMTKEEYIEPGTGLNFDRATEEELERIRYAIFYSLAENWSAGYAWTRSVVRSGPPAAELTTGSDERRSFMWLGLLEYKPPSEGWTVRLGAGEFESHLLRSDPTFVFSLSWDVLPKLGY